MFTLDDITRIIGDKNNIGDKNMIYESMSPYFTETFDEIVNYLESNDQHEFADYLKHMKEADRLYQGIYRAAKEAEEKKKQAARRNTSNYGCGSSISSSSGCGGSSRSSSSSWGCGSSGGYRGGC